MYCIWGEDEGIGRAADGDYLTEGERMKTTEMLTTWYDVPETHLDMHLHGSWEETTIRYAQCDMEPNTCYSELSTAAREK
jgi:hypothetical protein